MVLKYPGAKWEPLGPQTEDPMKSHDILCAHTMVGSLAGTSDMFHANGYGGTESHFGMGESKDQGVEQWQDLMYSADANLDGWHRVVSVETADYGGVFGRWDTSNAANVPAWTNDQLDMMVAIVVWFCRKETHANCPSTWQCHQVGVPCVLIPDSKPGRRGIGYHKQGCDPYRVTGGEKWSKAYGKECPSDKRINQLKTIVIPRAQKILGGGAGEELDMDEARFMQLLDAGLVKYGLRLYSPQGTEGAWHAQAMQFLTGFRAEEAGRYRRYEAIHAATITALKAQTKVLQDQLAAMTKAEMLEDSQEAAAMAELQASLDEMEKQLDEALANIQNEPEPPVLTLADLPDAPAQANLEPATVPDPN